MSISTSKWPELQRIAPSFIRLKWEGLSTERSPVALIKISPILAASTIGITRKPSIAASSARTGSTSVTITSAPSPRARGDSAPAPSVARDHHDRPGDQNAGRADHAVHRGLSRAVAVVEQMLGL